MKIMMIYLLFFFLNSPQANYTNYGYIPPTSGLNYTNFGNASPIYGQNYTNYTWNNTSKQFESAPYNIQQFPGYNVSIPSKYNATKDGHLFVGYIQQNDKLLFNRVKTIKTLNKFSLIFCV